MTAGGARAARIGLWRLEWLRLVRTRRLVAILGVYLFFGFTGPLTARYLSTILGRVGTGGVTVRFPTPTPADGMAQFESNAAQIGLLVVVMVAASALAFDARREMAVFLRTRVDTVSKIIVPAYTVNALAAVLGLVVGSLAAWYETAVLLGGLPPGRMLAGIALGSLFLAFTDALVALIAGLVKGVPATAAVTLVLLLGLALVGNLGVARHWLPTSLAGALPNLLHGTSPVDYLPAAGLTILLTGAALAGAVALGTRREL